MSFRRPFTPITAATWLSHLQKGNGLGMYSGKRYQRGSGLGAVFGSLLRNINPVFNSAGKKPFYAFNGTNKKSPINPSFTFAGTTNKKVTKKPRKKQTKNKTQTGNGFGIRPTTTPRVAGGPLKTIKATGKQKKRIGRKKKTQRDSLGRY